MCSISSMALETPYPYLDRQRSGSTSTWSARITTFHDSTRPSLMITTDTRLGPACPSTSTTTTTSHARAFNCISLLYYASLKPRYRCHASTSAPAHFCCSLLPPKTPHPPCVSLSSPGFLAQYPPDAVQLCTPLALPAALLHTLLRSAARPHSAPRRGASPPAVHRGRRASCRSRSSSRAHCAPAHAHGAEEPMRRVRRDVHARRYVA